MSSTLPPRESYTRTATLDVRDALATALRKHVEGLRFVGAQGTDRFSQVFEEFPSFNDRAVPPSACVLQSDWRYGDAMLSPTLLEDTWEPKGMPGWGLYQTAEVICELQLVIRTNLPGERPVLMKAIEDSFQDPDMLMSHSSGARYGIVTTLSEYYGLPARFALLGGSVIDSEEKAMREERDAVFTISAMAPKVQVGPVYPLAVLFKLSVNGETA